MRSILLPYLAHAERYEDVADVLWSLDVKAGWLVTPCIAYAVQRLISHQIADRKAEEEIRRAIYGYMDIVRKLGSDYWGRAQCSAILQASACLVENRLEFPSYLANEIEEFILECHGLSAEFWQITEPLVNDVGAIRRGADHFNVIKLFAEAERGARASLKDQLINALRYFWDYNRATTLRFLIELLPYEDQLRCLSGEISGLRPKPDLAIREIVRVVAHPLFNGDITDHIQDLLRALPACSTDVPQTPARNETISVVAALRDYEKGIESGANKSIDIAVLEQQIISLIRTGASDKAIELMLLLVSLVIRASETAEAIRLCAKANAILGKHASEAKMPGAQAVLRKLGRVDSKWHPIICDLLQYAEAGADRHEILSGGVEHLVLKNDSQASLIFDTIVVVISCRKYLSERSAAVVDSWAVKMRALGIPYVFAVGGGSDRLVDNILELDCSDDYEHLPEKVLSAIKWVHSNTSFGFMMKIDDDCFLNVDEFFLDHSFRKYDYYGRRIYRPLGGMDRMWHMTKSTSHAARHELDKSPEPSVYADGGSGYTISRTAMEKIVEKAETSYGTMLKGSSYMEDKLIGDLLHLSEISLASEGYNVAVFRKPPMSDSPVGMFSNSFLPSRIWPVKLAHLDSPSLFKRAAAQSEAFTLRPAKVWPSYALPVMGGNTNALELVSEHPQVPHLLSEEYAVVSCVRNERHVMPAFLKHYRELGVKSFLIADNCSTDGTMNYLLEQPDVVCLACDTEYKHSTFGVAWQQAILSAFRGGLWSVVVDADEFLVFPGYEKKPLSGFLEAQGGQGYDAITCLMLDMYPEGDLCNFDLEQDDPFATARYVDREPLRRVWFHGPYSNAPSWTSSLRHRLAPNASVSSFTSQKTCILRYKPWMQLSAGLHYVGDANISTQPGVLCHFKYHSGFHAKVASEIQRNQHFDDSSEYRAYAAALEGGFNAFYSSDGSIEWREAGIIKDALSGNLTLRNRMGMTVAHER